MKLPSRTVADPAAQYNFEKLERTIDPAPVTSLPTTDLYVGRRIVYAADAANGVYWDLVYVDPAATYPWAALGRQNPIIGVSNAQQNETLTSAAFVYQDMASSPTVVLPLAGDYLLEWGVEVFFNTAGTVAYDFAVHTSGNTLLTQPARVAAANGDRDIASYTERVNGIAATTLKIREAGSNTTVNGFSTISRYLMAAPVRVG